MQKRFNPCQILGQEEQTSSNVQMSYSMEAMLKEEEAPFKPLCHGPFRWAVLGSPCGMPPLSKPRSAGGLCAPSYNNTTPALVYFGQSHCVEKYCAPAYTNYWENTPNSAGCDKN